MSTDLAGWVKAARNNIKFTQEQLADRLEMTKANVSAFETGRNLPSYAIMCKISEICNWPMPHLTASKVSHMVGDSDSVIIPQFNISASCGSGVLNPDFPELLRAIQIPIQSINELFKRNNLNNIQIISPDGDSMEPTIPKKSVAFVDTECKEFNGDGVYVFVYDGECYMKRLQRVPVNRFFAISDNSRYEKFEINLSDGICFRIVAKLVKVLSLDLVDL